MSRTRNQLSAIQSDDKRFEAVCEAIDVLTWQVVARDGGIGRTSMFKYRSRKPVDRQTEIKILTVLENAAKKKTLSTKKMADHIMKAA